MRPSGLQHKRKYYLFIPLLTLKVRASVKPIAKGDRLVIRRAGVRIKKGKIKGGKKVRRIISSIPRNKQRQG